MLLIISLIPIALVTVYASNPWFTISSQLVNAIVITFMALVIIGILVLSVSFVKLAIDLQRQHHSALPKDMLLVKLSLTFVLAVVLFVTLVRLAQPLS